MDDNEAVQFWFGHIGTEEGRKQVGVMLRNAPVCEYGIRCGHIATGRRNNVWLCNEHGGKPNASPT